MKELHQQHRRHWISPISKLEELFHNPFIREQRLQEKIERRLQLKVEATCSRNQRVAV
jgi:hypothetical protein